MCVVPLVHVSARGNESLAYVPGILGEDSPVLPLFPTSRFPFSLLDHSHEHMDVLSFLPSGKQPFLTLLPPSDTARDGECLSWSWQGHRWVGCIREDGVEADTGCLVFSLCRDLQAISCKACIPEMEAGEGRVTPGKGLSLLEPLVIFGGIWGAWSMSLPGLWTRPTFPAVARPLGSAGVWVYLLGTAALVGP